MGEKEILSKIFSRIKVKDRERFLKLKNDLRRQSETLSKDFKVRFLKECPFIFENSEDFPVSQLISLGKEAMMKILDSLNVPQSEKKEEKEEKTEEFFEIKASLLPPDLKEFYEVGTVKIKILERRKGGVIKARIEENDENYGKEFFIYKEQRL